MPVGDRVPSPMDWIEAFLFPYGKPEPEDIAEELAYQAEIDALPDYRELTTAEKTYLCHAFAARYEIAGVSPMAAKRFAHAMMFGTGNKKWGMLSNHHSLHSSGLIEFHNELCAERARWSQVK